MRKSVLRFLWLASIFLFSSYALGPTLRPWVQAQGITRARLLRVKDVRVAQRLERLGARLVADYGGYRLYEAEGGAVEEAARSRAVDFVDEYRFVLLNAGPIDTESAEAQTLRSAEATETFDGRRLHIVQFAGPARPNWISALRDTGVRIVTYLPHNAYLIYGDSAALGALHELGDTEPFLRWDAPYRVEQKMSPRIRTDRRDRTASKGKRNAELFAIQLVHDPAVNPTTVGTLEAGRRGTVRGQFRVMDYVNLIVSLDPSELDAVAAQPDVISIQPFAVPQKSGERQGLIVAGDLSGTSPGYFDRLASWGFTQQQFTASGFAVDISDSGIDDATTTPNHPGLYIGGDPSNPSRIAYNRLEGSPIFGDVIEGCDGHGNINAHIVAGYSDGFEFPFADAEGFRYGLGIAPFVRVGSSVIFAPSYTYPNFVNLQARAYNDGARISSNSWGGLVNGAYDVTAQTFDALVRDAQPAQSTLPSPGNQQMVIVVAAGNEGAEGLRSPGTAKNVITVGASENIHPVEGTDGCGWPDTGSDNAEDIADFSSRGPTLDGRAKPDLVAPGTRVSGGVYQTENPGATGEAHPCFDGTGVCGSETSSFFPEGQELYTISTGTSHSTPAVAGAAALVRQHFLNLGMDPPTPAMTKALLMNTARYLTGHSANDGLWSNSQGMGLTNLAMSFDTVPKILHDQRPEELFTASGQTLVVSGTIVDPTRPFRVTLVWTDAPGSTTGPAFNNDLDLTVSAGGQLYKGNVFSGAFSVPGGEADMRNNAESVLLPAGTTGDFAVTVTAANINSDGVPGVGGGLDQDFALVVYNADEIPRPSVAAAGATLTEEDCGPGNGVLDPGELVTVELALVNVGVADTVDLVATLEPSGGVTSPSGPQNYGILEAGGAAATRSFSFVADGSCGGEVVVTLSLQDGGIDTGAASFDLPLGLQIPSGLTTTRTNPSSIVIPAGGSASPYPSSIEVAAAEGQVGSVQVVLHAVSHPFPDDLDVLLVAPNGQSVLLMSDAGGGVPVQDVELTFDDAADSILPDGTQIESGVYRPTNWEGWSDDFAPPAPTGPYGGALAGLAGIDPNGTWSLYVTDDFFLDGGRITGGWSLIVETTIPVCCGVEPGFMVHPTDGLSTTEAGGTATFTVALTTIPSDEVTIAFESSDPTEGVVSPAELVFGPADALLPRTVTVTGVDDGLVDGDVAFTVVTAPAVSNDPDYLGLDPSDVQVVNINDDRVSVSIDDTTAAEGDSGSTPFVFTVTLAEPCAHEVSVVYATQDGTAKAGSDYVANAGSLIFPPGELSRTITVAVIGDSAIEEDETFTVHLAGSDTADIADGIGLATIVNDDQPVTPTLEVSKTSVAPGESVQVTVSDGPGNRLDWVALAPVGSPVTINVDWQYLNGTRVAPPEGLTSAVLTFKMPKTSGDYELRLFANNGYTLLATSPAVTVEPPALAVSATSTTPGESVQVSVTNGPANRLDWVSLAAVGSPLTSYLDWQFLSGTRVAPPVGLTSAELTFVMPTAPGPYEFRFFLNNGYTLLATSAVVTVELSTTPELVVTPPSVSFGSVDLGSSADRNVTVQNVGGGDLTGEATVSGFGFSIIGEAGYSLGAGETAALMIRFEPVATGEAIGTLSLTGGGGATVGLSGAGVAPPTLTVSSPSARPGASVQVSVTNGPGSRYDWVSLAAAGSALTSYLDWQYLNGTRVAPPEGLTSAVLTFVMPQTLGLYEFRFFAANGYTLLATSPLVTVEPSTTPELEVTPSSVAFGSVAIGSSADRNVTIRNVGGGTLNGEAAVTGDGFDLVGISSYSLEAGETATLTVRFQPLTTGESGGTLTLTGGGGATVVLTGTGLLGPTLTVSATSVSPGRPLQVTVSNGPGNPKDWVALAAVGSSLTSWVDWKYLSGTRVAPPVGLTSAVLTFTMPLTSGPYELRFFADSGYTLLATSPVVNVVPPVLTPSVTSAAPGEPVLVSVTNGPGNPKDWVSLAVVGSPVTSNLDWKYLSGTRTPPPVGLTSAQLTFVMPQTPGAYELRFFVNNSYTLLATSATITVVSSPD